MDKEKTDYTQPVAYDAQGRPLYAHPPTNPKPELQPSEQAVANQATEPKPAEQIISDEIKQRHEASRKQYPELNLTDGEYVIFAVKRHPIALAPAFGLAAVLIGLALSVFFNYDLIVAMFELEGVLASPMTALLPILLFCVLVGIGMYTAYFLYSNNSFFLTNESIIKKMQFSLFSHQEQTISLGEVEDVNYSQSGILQLYLNYGSLRMSTVGEEHTYDFDFVHNPKQQSRVLNNAVEAFKNGRQF